MKKFLLLTLTLFLVGCSHNSPPLPLEKTNLTPPPMTTSPTSIDEQAKNVKLFTYDLPIANESIRERKVSGFLDEKKTGKITRKTVGLATVTEEFYYAEGSVIFVRILTQAPETDQNILELTFENSEMTTLKKNGEGVEDVSTKQYVAESNKNDAENLLQEFTLKQEL